MLKLCSLWQGLTHASLYIAFVLQKQYRTQISTPLAMHRVLIFIIIYDIIDLLINKHLEETIMTYKNGIKEYTMTTLLFGVPMGFLFGLKHQSALLGVISGILCGCLFTLLTFLFVKRQEKKYDKKRIEIAKERKVICDGGATVQGNGGWMFFTDYGLEFYPHKINLSKDDLIIPINTIKSVETNKNQLIVDTTENLKFAIVVSHNKEWLKQIKQYINI